MIESLKKTFEYFPKHENEEDRSLSVTSYSDEIKVRLVIYINGIRHTTEQIVSQYEYEMFKADGEDVLLRRICRHFEEAFSE